MKYQKLPLIEWAKFEDQQLHWDAELESAYQEAWGAVIFGARWTGKDVDELSKDEALEYAATLLRLLKSRREDAS